MDRTSAVCRCSRHHCLGPEESHAERLLKIHEVKKMTTTDRVEHPLKCLPRALILRFCLVPVAVGVCYLFQWDALRSITTRLSVRMTEWTYPDWTRVGPDMAYFRGT